MNTPSAALRLVSAAAAALLSFALLNSVLAIAEPQHNLLMAKLEHVEKHAPAGVAIAMASNTTAKSGR